MRQPQEELQSTLGKALGLEWPFSAVKTGMKYQAFTSFSNQSLEMGCLGKGLVTGRAGTLQVRQPLNRLTAEGCPLRALPT